MTQPLAADRTALLQFNESEFRQKFPVAGFKVGHHLSTCTLFDLSRLVQLAKQLPEQQVEYFAGQVPVDQDPEKHPRNGLSIVETVRRIEDCGSWMVLKNVELDPDYGNLLRSVLDAVYRQVRSSVIGIHREEAFIFISSPKSVTPFHLDEEHNFLLQIRGAKEVSMWDPRDRTVMSESQAERMLEIWHSKGYHRNMKFEEKFQSRATVFQLHPGEGLHFPVGAPHWVQNGPDVSVSFSATFRSGVSERQSMVYFANQKLRRLGLEPTPPGQSDRCDSIKVVPLRLLRGSVRALRKAASAMGRPHPRASQHSNGERTHL